MERLTVPDEKIEGGARRTVIDAREVKKNAMTIYWALKKYEDTGLTPAEIRELKERDTAKAAIYQVQGDERYEQEPEWWMCPCCEEVYDMDDDYDFCPNCGQRILR